MKPVKDMTEAEKAQIRAWLRNWEELGPILEGLRQDELRRTGPQVALEILDGLFTEAVRTTRPRSHSGLEVQQKLFARARR